MVAIPAHEASSSVLRPSRYHCQLERNFPWKLAERTSTKKIAGKVMMALTSVMPIPSTPAEPGSRGLRTGVE